MADFEKKDVRILSVGLIVTFANMAKKELYIFNAS